MPTSFPRPLVKQLTVTELLRLVPDEDGLIVVGNGDQSMASVAALDAAEPDSLVFCKTLNPRLAAKLVEESKANVIVVGTDIPEKTGRCLIKVDDPMRYFIRVIRALFPNPPSRGIHPTAQISEGAQIAENVEIDPYAVIGKDVFIGRDTSIGSGTHIEAETSIGVRCKIAPNCTIGTSGLGVSRGNNEVPLHFPHLGRVIIGDDVGIGAQTCIMRGILKDTRIGDWTNIGSLVNIAHNCQIDKNCWISARAILCGSIHLEPDVMVGAGAAINNHVTIGAGATVGLGSVVTKNVSPQSCVFGIPARTLKTMRPIT